MPLPSDPISVNAAIRACIVSLLSLDSNYMRPANQNAPTGHVNQPFGTVLITDYEPVGQDSRTVTDLGVKYQLTETIEGTRHVVCDVQFFRANAYSLASRLNAIFRSDTANMLLQQNGLSFVKCGSARNITEITDTLWEERAQVQVEFYVASTETLVISTLDTVEVNIQTEEQSVSTEVNLDVNP